MQELLRLDPRFKLLGTARPYRRSGRLPHPHHDPVLGSASGYAALGAGTSAGAVSATALTSGGSPLDVLARWISII